jgi:anti-sigma factor ChrR (cupin superfamily)
MTDLDMVSTWIVDITALDWEEFLPGVMVKRVWSDPDTNRSALFVRMSPGAALPRHVHNGDELAFVLEGSVADEFGTIYPGGVGYRPNGCTHAVHSPKGATTFTVISGGIQPVSDAGDGGPPSEVFDLATASWVDYAPGVRQKVFWSDDASRRVAALGRTEPGASLPAHRHTGDELVFVIEGTVEDEAGALRPGLVGYRPPGCVHTVRTHPMALRF